MVYTFNPLDDPRWEAFVGSHPASGVFHTVAWVRALRDSYGYEPVVYTTSPPDAPAIANGVLVCRVKSMLTGRRLVSVPFADHCEPLVGEAADREQLAGALVQAAGSGWKYVELRPLDPGWMLPASPLVQRGASFRRHTLDLTPDLGDIFNRFHGNTIQRKIRRAGREGLVYETGRSEAFLDAFYRLMLLTRRRHGVPPQPRHWFTNLARAFGDRLTVALVSKNGRAVGSVLTLRHGSTLVYKYGCSDAQFHALGTMPFIFWRTIEKARAEGVECFDLGRSDLDAPGLITFKQRLGGRDQPLEYVRYSMHASRAGRPMRIPQVVLARLPDALFVAAGRALYRHAG